jgi:hypothetical protein
MQIKTRHLGAVMGFAFGWLIIEKGLPLAVFVGVVAAVGWVIGRVLDGEIDLQDFVRRRDGENFD